MSPNPDPSYRTPPPGGYEPAFNLPPGTLWVTLAIVAVFVLEAVLPGAFARWLFSNFAFISPFFWPPGSSLPTLGGVVSLVTHAFLHADLMHLALNLGFLLAFGSFVERSLGLIAFLLLFVVCAMAGALAEFAFSGGQDLVLIGASGAVYGITGAAVRLMLLDGETGRRRSALNFVLVIMGLNLLLGVSGLGDFLAGSQVGWKAHAGGFVVGLLLAAVLAASPPKGRG